MELIVQFKKKIHGYGTKTVTFSNEEINDMVNTVKALEDADILEKGIRITLQNDVKKGKSFANFTNVIRHFRLIINRTYTKWKRIVQSWYQ